ncbi:SMI1/KNR4 family protein [Kitasatospora sp. NPDC005751]|uniref:SMI1/KNR4 family protein n=1 Tax=unclassified Kitasatospora TaxID=2633591 RepID=UPI00340301BA
MSHTLGDLEAIMGMPDYPPLEVPWNKAVEQLGVPFPSDYRAFIERYGPVCFSGDLVVASPSLKPDILDEARFDGLYRFNQNLSQMMEQWGGWFPEAVRPYGPFLAPGGLLGWASNTSADYFCWHMVGSDPDQWPVVVWRYGGDEMNRFDGGMVDFLVAVLSGEFPDAEEMIDRNLDPCIWKSLLRERY